MKYLLGLCLLILMSGCAVMDLSVMDTAEPLKDGHIKLETFASTGLILETAVWDEEDDFDQSRKAMIWPVMGLKFGTGISDSAEVGIKGWGSIGTIGAKAYYKYLYDHTGNVYSSVIPALTYTGIKSEEGINNDNENPNNDYKYTSFGVELPLLVTNKLSEYISLTAALKANYNYFQYQYTDEQGFLEKRGPYSIVHGGALCNARIKLLYLILTPEVGVEVVPVVNGDITLLPNGGLTIGLQF